MPLILRIISYQRLTPGQQNEFSTSADQFTIGRSSENDWAIPDPQLLMSGVHCRIERKGDEYHLTDLSTNGVFVNGSSERVQRNSTIRLNAGDRFIIGDYEIEVEVSSQAAVAGDAEGLTEDFDIFDQPAPPMDEPEPADDPFVEPAPAPAVDDDSDFLKPANTPLSHLDENPLGTGVDIDDILGLGDADGSTEAAPDPDSNWSPIHDPVSAPRERRPEPPASAGETDWDSIPDNWDETTGIFKTGGGEPDTPQSPDVAPEEIPDNWDEMTGMFAAPQPPAEPETRKPPADQPPAEPPPAQPVAKKPTPEPQPVSPATPAPQPVPSAPGKPGGALSAFERGAGLKPGLLEISDEEALFEQLGRMVRSCTEGLMQTLSGRASVKSEFRLNQTMIRPVENNPLKFSPTVPDALSRLFRQADQAYMSGEQAFAEGFEDINAHQIAVVAGMEAALQGILQKFDPKSLESRLVSGSFLDGVLPGGKKAKYWDIFVLLYDEIAKDAEDDFQKVFGQAFTKAYEAQLERLKSERQE